MNNMSWVNRQIAVGGAFTDKDIPMLEREGVDAVLDMRSEKRDNENLLKKHGMSYLQVKVDDTMSPSFDELEAAFSFVEPLLEMGQKVLVHCQNGAGRSTLVVVAILALHGMKISDAVRRIKDRHPTCGFSRDQESFLNNKLGKFLESRRKD